MGWIMDEIMHDIQLCIFCKKSSGEFSIFTKTSGEFAVFEGLRQGTVVGERSEQKILGLTQVEIRSLSNFLTCFTKLLSNDQTCLEISNILLTNLLCHNFS